MAIRESEHAEAMRLAARIGVAAATRPRMCMRCWQNWRRSTPAVREIDNFDYCLPCLAAEDYSPADGKAIVGPVPEKTTNVVTPRPQPSAAADLTPDAVLGNSASPLPRDVGAAAAAEPFPGPTKVTNPNSPWRRFGSLKGGPANVQEEQLKTKAVSGDPCQNPECRKPLPAGHDPRTRYCNLSCKRRANYLRHHEDAKPAKASAVADNGKPNGHGNGLDARHHMRLAQPTAPPSLDSLRPLNGSGMKISEQHLDAWWMALEPEAKFGFFVRIMFPGVGVPVESEAQIGASA